MLLTNEEKVGLQVLALSQFDQLDGAECAGCNRQEAWNCAGEEREEVIAEYPIFGLSFTACPLTYVPETVWQFFEEYTYYELRPATAAGYGDAGSKAWAATKFLKNCFNTIEAEMIKMQQAKHKNHRFGPVA